MKQPSTVYSYCFEGLFSLGFTERCNLSLVKSDHCVKVITKSAK